MSFPLHPPPTREVAVTEEVVLGGGRRIGLIAGPCALESEELALTTAERIAAIARDLGIPYIFKSSYDKANRTSVDSYRGPGLEEGLRILERVKGEVGVPLLSDVHTEQQVGPAAEVLDVLQVPAFLCRQTDFVVAVAASGRAVNIKKGQFLAPWDAENVLKKALSTGNQRITLTERGVSFGYNNLVSDMRSLPILREFGYPVVFDCTHSVQLPGGLGGRSGGQRKFVPYLTRAAVAAGVDALFMEVHPDPDAALSDGPNMVPLEALRGLLEEVVAIEEALRERRT
ncbi:MAG: 3-deoxy-8-phosphooctulonate synthase [Nitrospirae bacterium]|nr:MAG: 3-deoxy-8-phosphooctulonate synthase [Nitrospirota bacterium]